MKRYGLLILIATAACSPNYESGKTQCSDKRECPSGFSCSDDGASGAGVFHYCVENKALVENTQTIGCTDKSVLYCSQSKTCWEKIGACATVVNCGAAKGYAICASASYHPDCNGDTCLPNGVVPVAGAGGSSGSTIVGLGGSTGAVVRRDGGQGGIYGSGGYARGGSGGTVARGGTSGGGGLYGSGGLSSRGGVSGSGGLYGSGGLSSRGGAPGSGGTTVISTGRCSETAFPCDAMYNSFDCSLSVGCVWNAATMTCAGTSAACSTYSSSGALCEYNGCAWTGDRSCSLTPITSFCRSMAIDDSCDICLFTSCCTAATTCYEDGNCYAETPNANFFALFECAFNCCGSVCFQ